MKTKSSPTKRLTQTSKVCYFPHHHLVFVEGSEEQSDVESEESDDETPDEKRLRLAKEYLQRLRQENEDDAEYEKKLQKPRLEVKHLTEQLESWNCNGSNIRVLRGHKLSPTCLALCDDGSSAYSGAKDSTIAQCNFFFGEWRRGKRGRKGWERERERMIFLHFVGDIETGKRIFLQGLKSRSTSGHYFQPGPINSIAINSWLILHFVWIWFVVRWRQFCCNWRSRQVHSSVGSEDRRSNQNTEWSSRCCNGRSGSFLFFILICERRYRFDKALWSYIQGLVTVQSNCGILG